MESIMFEEMSENLRNCISGLTKRQVVAVFVESARMVHGPTQGKGKRNRLSDKNVLANRFGLPVAGLSDQEANTLAAVAIGRALVLANEHADVAERALEAQREADGMDEGAPKSIDPALALPMVGKGLVPSDDGLEPVDYGATRYPGVQRADGESDESAWIGPKSAMDKALQSRGSSGATVKISSDAAEALDNLDF